MNLLSGKKWFTWRALAGLALTSLILFVVFRQIGPRAFMAALQQTQIGWFLMGFLSYGLAIWLGSLRWHLALRLTDRAIHLSASSRLFLIGHFFYVVLFGAAGGDVAKSISYARYYRFAIPEVLAAAPLDRLLGFAGNVLLATVVVSIALFNGGFENLGKLQLAWPGVWLLCGVTVAILIGIAIIFSWPASQSGLGRTIQALRIGARRLALTPSLAAPGSLFAFMSITALAAVFGFNLRAVSQTHLPWAGLLWTFPAITIISSLPFTFGGAGLREMAALALLGLYGVPPGECVAASLLTLAQKLLWGAVGAFVLAREEGLQRKFRSQKPPQSISIVIPVVDEAGGLPETVRRARVLPEVIEIIVVHEEGQTPARLMVEEAGCRVVCASATPGTQLKMGAARATGDVVMLLRADTWLPPQAGHAVLNCLRDGSVAAGGFWRVVRNRPLLLLAWRIQCAARLLIGRRVLEDQAMFVRRDLLERIGMPDGARMAHAELCRRLRKLGRLALAEGTVTTLAGHSKERFLKMNCQPAKPVFFS